MSTTVNNPPGRTFYVRTFVISLVIVFGGLATFLFAVRMESTVAGKGIIRSRQEVTLRANAPGVVQLGWYEGKVTKTQTPALSYRVDVKGNGLAKTADGNFLIVKHDKTPNSKLPTDDRVFRALKAGDFVWPGQVMAAVPKFQEEPLTAPTSPDLWLVQQVHVEHLSAIKAGDKVVTLVPVDGETKQPIDLVADVTFDEEHAAEVAQGQTVRLYSNMYNARLHGKAEGVVRWIHPWISESGTDGRHIRVQIEMTQSPFPLRLGAGVVAKVVVGRKPVYRIILEH